MFTSFGRSTRTHQVRAWRTFAARGTDKPGLDASKLTVEKTTAPKALPAMEGLAFGKHFSDHMLEVDWEPKGGWGAPRIKPYGNLSISPSAAVLHYAVECFEGMKAYKDSAGKIRLFRPDCNVQRLNDSVDRLHLPGIDYENFVKALGELLKIDERWIPEGEGYSLYLRPTVIATDEALGLGICNNVKLFVITCPVGPYYPTGFKPIKLLADDLNVRAWPGGCGASKVGGNYAPTIKPAVRSFEQGCAQVLWLYPEGDDHLVTEVGAMNVFFVIAPKGGGKPELITAPLDGTILPGVTRRTVLELCRNSGDYTVSERALGMKEVSEAAAEGRLMEAFGTGTAAVIAPINCVLFKGKDIDIPTGSEIGPIAKRMWNEISAIQYGRVEGHPWSVVVK